MDRRQFFKTTGGLAAMLASRWAFAGNKPTAKAKACIVLWMNGGPSHVDTWDPKSGAVAGPGKAIATKVDGLAVSEHLPQLAELAPKLAVLRGMTSREGNHDRARHLLHTGYPPNPTVAYPALGSWVAESLGPTAADLPSFVSVLGPSQGAGFLGVQHGPFVIGNPSEPPQNTAYARDVDFARFVRRRGALDYLDNGFEQVTGDRRVHSRRQLYDKSIKLMYSSKLKAFETSEEPDAVRAAYGDSDFGRGCLLARRLVDNGVRFVEVTLDGWDTHFDNFGRTQKLMGALDPAMATLLRELEERHLLDSTLVVWAGEFGRTPKINAKEGRDHFPAAWSVVLAGGGLRTGQVLGATDDEGGKVVTRPTSVPDLFATLATQLGLDPDETRATPLGRPVGLTDHGTVIKELV